MLSAGTGRVDISPQTPTALWGYPYSERISTGVHDPLYATALCLDDGADRILSLSADVLFVDADLVATCREQIQARTGIPTANILICATHTHSGPITCDIMALHRDPAVPGVDEAYVELLQKGIVEAGCQAVDCLVPAEVAVTSAQVDGVGCNRISPDATRDPEAGIVAIRKSDDRTIMALQVFYSMHPTVMHEDSTLASSDFPAYARQQIEEAFPGARVLYHNGPSGNLSPRYHVKGQTFAEAERLGHRLGVFITGAMKALRDDDFCGDLKVQGMQGYAQLPPREMMSVEKAEAGFAQARAEYERLKRENAGHGPVRTAECVAFGADEVVTIARAHADGTLAPVQEAHARAEVQLLCIGDTCLVAFPGECFVEYALQVKEQSPTRTFVSSMANGHLQGYITTPGHVGYEANLSIFKPESGALMVATALGLIEKVGA